MKKITLLLTLVFITLFAINVKADSFNYYLEREGDTWSYLNVPKNIKSGDIIKVNAIIETATNYQKGLVLKEGRFSLEWDKNVFELVPYEDIELFSEPALYSINTNTFETMRVYSQSGDGTMGYIGLDFKTDDDYVEYGKNKVVEFTFKVRENVKDGIYTIKQTGDYIKIISDTCYDWDYCEWIDTYLDNTLSFQVGDQPIESSYSKNKIPNSTYVIGNHLFTRAGSDAYDGVLTTEYIMLASKSIESNKKEDMIIYAKNARGNWINAITNESITPPDYFDISYIDMKNNSKNNGIYIYNDIAVQLIELDETSAVVRIESDNIFAEGIATVSDGVATLTVDGKTYRITMGKERITLQTSDNYLSNCTLSKKYEYTLTDLYENELYEGRRQYFGTKYNGKFVLGNKEIYTYQSDEYSVRVIIKNTSNDDIIFDWYMYIGDNDNEIEYDNYRIVYGENKIVVYDTTNNVPGTYTKETRLSLEEVVKLLVANRRMIAVRYTANIGNGYYSKGFYDYGSHADDMSSSLPDLPGYEFAGWYLNNTLYNFNTPVTAPITLVGKWENNMITPVLSIGETDYYNTRSINITNMDDYCAIDVCSGSIEDEYTVDGFELYIKDGNDYNLVDEFYNMDTYDYTFDPNTSGVYAIRTFINNGYDRIFSAYSNEVELDITFPAPEIVFAPEAGSGPQAEPYDILNNIEITNFNSYGYAEGENNTWESYKIDGFNLYEKVGDIYALVSGMTPEELFMDVGTYYGITKHYYVRAYAYKYSEFDDEPIYSAYSNELVLEAPLPTPEISFAIGDAGFAQDLIIENEADYCIGTCDGSESDQYRVSGYEIYEKIGNNYTLVITRDNPLSYYGFSVTNNTNQDKVYAVRMFVTRGSTTTYSDYSNDLVVEADTTSSPVYACYYNSSTQVYVWGDYSGIAGYTLQENMTSEESCHVPEEQPACYLNNDNTYVWGNYSGIAGYTLQENMTSEEACHVPEEQPACYLYNDNTYVWGNYSGIAGYTLQENMTSEEACHVPEEQPACYLYNDNTYVWGNYSGIAGYTLQENMTSEESCHVPEEQPACYLNESTNTYVWGMYSQHEGYTLEPNIDNGPSCTAANG